MIRIVIGSEIKLFRWRVNRTKFWIGSKLCLKKKHMFFMSICLPILIIVSWWYMEKPSSFSINYLSPLSKADRLFFFLWLVSNSCLKMFLFIFEIEFIFQFEYYIISFISDSKLVSMKINFISFPKFGKRCFWSRFKFMCWKLQQFSCLTSAFEDKCWTILKLMQKLS